MLRPTGGRAAGRRRTWRCRTPARAAPGPQQLMIWSRKRLDLSEVPTGRPASRVLAASSKSWAPPPSSQTITDNSQRLPRPMPPMLPRRPPPPPHPANMFQRQAAQRFLGRIVARWLDQSSSKFALMFQSLFQDKSAEQFLERLAPLLRLRDLRKPATLCLNHCPGCRLLASQGNIAGRGKYPKIRNGKSSVVLSLSSGWWRLPERNAPMCRCRVSERFQKLIHLIQPICLIRMSSLFIPPDSPDSRFASQCRKWCRRCRARLG